MFKELNIIKVFFETPTKEFNVREIARILKIAPATASSYLNDFYKKGILKKRIERNLLLYKSDTDNLEYKNLKLYYNLRKINNSKLIDELNKFYLKPTIILFGSTLHGLDNEDSDIDLVIISEKKQEFPDKKNFEKKLNRRIQLFVVKDIKELRNEHLINNVLNGLIIQGEIKWI